MSGKNVEPTPPEKPIHDGPTKTGRLVRLKKAGWIVFGTALSAMVVVCLFALVSAKSGSGLIISIDRHTASESHFTMGLLPRTGTSGSDSSGQGQEDPGERILVGEPLGKADCVEHKSVKEYYDANIAKIETNDTGKVQAGSWNYIDEKGTPLALFYTFYLNNTNDQEEQAYGLSARLNSELTQSPEAAGRRPYDYVRLGVYIGDYGEPDDTFRVFANSNTKRWGTDYNNEKVKDDYRECLARTGSYDDYGKNEAGENIVTTYRYPKYSTTFDEKEIAFCEMFDTGNDGLGLFDVRDIIAPGTSRRITFFAYLEGEDPDSYSDSPINQSLGFSLSVGI